MILYNLKLIYRSFKRFKSIFFINLIGLSSGLTCTLLIYLWVLDELTIDRFHVKKERIFYAWEHRIKADGIWTSRNSSAPLAKALVEDMAEVEYACPSTRPQAFTLSVGDKTLKANGRYSGLDFFRIFTYRLVSGSAGQVLQGTKSIVISQSLALKFFNTTDNVVGKMIELDHAQEFIVTGIFETVPQSSSEQFEFVLPFQKYEAENEWVNGWGNTGLATYVLLRKNVDPDAFNKKIADYVKVKTNNEIKYRTLFMKKYADVYLYGNYENGVLTGGRIMYVKLFSIIAVFILVIACINFMNLSTAKASRRIKEVGIKKAVGAGRNSLMLYYLGESILISYISMTLAVLLVDVFMEQFNNITGKQLSLHLDGGLVLTLAGIGLVTGILAGSYPAVYISGFAPAAVLKGKLNTSLGELWARKGLVVFQFALSVILIVSVLIVYKQIEYVQSANLGYERENILYLYREGKVNDFQTMETLISEFKRVPGVINVSSSSHNLTGHNSGTWGLTWEGKDPEDKTEFENFTVNYDMMETLGIQMEAGRMFSRNYPADTAKLIITRKGIDFMGIKNPIGAKVNLWGRDMQIIGIAKDFHYESLHENIKPVFFRLGPDDTNLIMVKVASKQQAAVIEQLRTLYTTVNPGFAFDYKFLDAQYQSQYIAEQRVSILSRYFAGLAILISCLGLFGLAAFTAERRVKEIGIRKVLGSSELGIVYLLSSEFTKTVFLSIVIALPVSYLLCQYWLQGFAFRIPLKIAYFLFAGLAAILIAWITVGIQALKAAKLNPVKCLKEE